MPNYKIAEILDPSWWIDDVPNTFADYLNVVQYDETLEPFEEPHTWETYLTMNGRQWQIDVKDENENTIKSYALFTRNGKPVDVPNNYTSSKLRFVTKREFDIYSNNDYLIHLITDAELGTNPKDIIWPKQVTGHLSTNKTHWKGDLNSKVHSLFVGDKKQVFCTEIINHNYDSKGREPYFTSDFYFYRANGQMELLKSPRTDIESTAEQEKRLRQRRFYMVEEAKAYTIGTDYETEALNYFKDHKLQFDNYIETGVTTILTTLAETDTEIEWWLLEEYELPNEQIVTIQQALIAYLTI